MNLTATNLPDVEFTPMRILTDLMNLLILKMVLKYSLADLKQLRFK